jgi:hypothetical protein
VISIICEMTTTTGNFDFTKFPVQVGPTLHPTPFCGRPTDDLLSFISHFERFSTFCGWDDDQRLRAMPLYFQGNVHGIPVYA